MCNVCTTYQPTTYATSKQYDPTRTLTLRRAFEREMNKRFDLIARLVRQAIVDRDVFGLQDMQTNALPNPRAFAFPRSGEKVAEFMAWLKQEVQNNVLQVSNINAVGGSIDAAWTNMYVAQSYQRGLQRGRAELIKAGYPNVPNIEETGGIQPLFNSPVNLDRVGTLYTRVFSDLQGITDAMSTQVSRVLSQGMIDGDNPRLLARKLNKVITGRGETLGITDTLGRYIPAKRRAQMLARTEVIRAHHLGTVQEYRNWGAEGIKVKAEWRTAGDARVCDICQSLEGNIYTLDEVEGMIPVHPNCRCLALPYKVEEDTANNTLTLDMVREANDEDWYKLLFEDFTSPVRDTLKIYTHKGYYVNRKILGGSTLSSYDKAYIRNLNMALDTLPNHTGKVYRGLRFRTAEETENFIASVWNKPEINFKAFTSTSRDIQTAKDFAGDIIMEVKSKTGKSISKFSDIEGEAEVLFKNNTKFKVNSVSKKEGYWWVKMEEI